MRIAETNDRAASVGRLRQLLRAQLTVRVFQDTPEGRSRLRRVTAHLIRPRQGEIPANRGLVRPAGFQAGQSAPRRLRRWLNRQFGQHAIRGDGGRGIQPLGVVQRFQRARRVAGFESRPAQRLPHGGAIGAMLHGRFQTTCGRAMVAGGIQRGRHIAIEPRPQIVIARFAGCRVKRQVKRLTGRRDIPFGGVANPQAGQVQRRQPGFGAWCGGVDRQQRALCGRIHGARRHQVRYVVSAILDVRHVCFRARAAA